MTRSNSPEAQAEPKRRGRPRLDTVDVHITPRAETLRLIDERRGGLSRTAYIESLIAPAEMDLAIRVRERAKPGEHF